MSKGTRASTHNGRAGKNGAYSAKHNDRQFDTSTTDHIDPTLTPQNENVRFGGDYGATTNEAHELAFYQDHFGESLERKNAGYKAKGKAGQVKTMEQYYRSVKSCPEETLYTVGKDIDPQLLWKLYREHQEWKAREFPQCQTLAASLHVDEPNAMPHIHERSVWIGHDAQGMEVVGQAKALAEMGVLPPDPEKKYGKYNNAKQTYTQICRAHFIEVCREHGLEIEVEPLPSDKVGLELTEYKIQHAQERAAEATQQATAAEKNLSHLESQVEAQAAQIEAQQSEIAKLQAELRPYKDLQTSIDEIDSTGRTILPGVVAIKKKDLEAVKEQAKGYLVNRDEIATLRERSAAVSQREQRADLREQQLDERAANLEEKDHTLRQMYIKQQYINLVLENTERDRDAYKAENARLKAENASLQAEVQKLKETLEKRLEPLRRRLRGAYESLASIVKAVRLLKYDKTDGYKVYGLSEGQERLIDGIAEYGASLARKDGFTGLAEDMERHYGISQDLADVIDPPQYQSAYDWDEGPSL